jgi:hypothetical protein
MTENYEDLYNQPVDEQAIKYILTDNSKLRDNKKILMKKMMNITHEKNQLEEELENLEKKHSYNKTIIKNFHEMNKLYKKIYTCQTKADNIVNANLKDYRQKTYKYFLICKTCSVITVPIILITLPIIHILVYILLLIPFILYSEFIVIDNNLIIPEVENGDIYKEIMNTKKEINDIYKTQDYIHEYIELL